MVSIAFEKYLLPNGLQVILHEDHSLPMVGVNVWYHVGSKNEEPGRTGFAHLFEHVMFEGSKNHNKNFFEPLQKVGAIINGSTTEDRTNYYENLPSSYLELALWLEADRMGFLLDALDQKRFDTQRDIVKNERRQRYENTPYGMAYLLLRPALYPEPHPYNWPVIGSMEDLSAASLDDVKEFFKTYYAPSNASLAIAGDIDREAVKKLVEKHFGDLPPGKAITRVGRMDAPRRGEVRIETSDKVQLPRLYLTYPSLPMFETDEAAMEVLAAVMGDGKSSRMYRTLVYEKQIARDVRVMNWQHEITGEFHIQATAAPGKTLEEVQAVIEDEIEKIKREPPTEREVQRSRNRILSNHVRALEHFGSRADQLNHYNIFSGDPNKLNTDLERYKAVTTEEISRAAAKYLGRDRVRLAVLPEKPGKALESALDRSQMPAGAQPRAFVPPMPRREKLANGLNVLFVERHELPVVAMELILRAGSITDPEDRPGLAHMVAAILPEGTKSRTSQEIADEMEFLGSHLETASGREYASITAETLTEQWERALEIVADVTQNPTFPDNEIERIRKERLTDLRRIMDDPNAISQRASRAIIYGPRSLYGHPLTGTIDSVSVMTKTELVSHFKAHYGPEDSTLIVVGDATRDQIMKAAEKLFGGWKRQSTKTTKEAASAAKPPTRGTTIYLADKPGAAQSIIRSGHLTIPRHDPDYFTMTFLNYVFGGHPTARLFMNLRQDKGYSYGYYSQVEWVTGPSVLFAGGSVQTAVTKESVVETIKEFLDLRENRPVSHEEFNATRDGMFRAFPSQFETLGQMVAQLSRIAQFGLPDDYYATLIPKLEAIKLEDMHRVAGKRIDPEHLAILVVGDAKVVEPRLRELGLPIVKVDAEGNEIS